MLNKKTKIIVTLGPSTNSEKDLRIIKDKKVDFVRINMSHSTIDDLRYFISLAKKVDIPFIIDTEGSQIRSGNLNDEHIYLEEGDEIRLCLEEIIGDKEKICLKPRCIVEQLEVGDILRLDFDTLILRISDTHTISSGYVTAKAITAGYLGRNKGVVVDSGSLKTFSLPCLSEKDYESIAIGLEENIGYVAASFMRSGESVEEVRRASKNLMKIISKIECVDGLENLDAIIEKSDYLLIDRGDLSKEIPLEKIPLTQKIILHRARKQKKEVFIATNLLETMVEKRKPTRAEVHDVVNSIMDGAAGLALSAETAIGKNPFDCINMLNRLILHVEQTVKVEDFVEQEDKLVKKMELDNYLLDIDSSSSLVLPHGGKLINRLLRDLPTKDYLSTLTKINLSENQILDVEAIAVGAFSPLEGFMGKEDLENVLNGMRLTDGTIWPLPIVLDVTKAEAGKFTPGQTASLVDGQNEIIGLLHLEEKYFVDKKDMAQKLYGTKDESHPGVRMLYEMGEVFLSGKVDLLKRRKSERREYELTPRQTRRLFDERGWTKIVGFHTRNVIHRSHEYIQLKAVEENFCDGLFIHPVVGKKKPGDFLAEFIIRSYELMMKCFYPKNKVVFATFPTYSRYAGPREAIFTALCRKNFGCSHFIVGRDHTGVGDFYSPTASHDIFDRFPDLGIIPIKFNQVFYSEKLQEYIQETEDIGHLPEDKLFISGTEARKKLLRKELPPAWFMREEISRMIIEALNNGEQVFVQEVENIQPK